MVEQQQDNYNKGDIIEGEGVILRQMLRTSSLGVLVWDDFAGGRTGCSQGVHWAFSGWSWRVHWAFTGWIRGDAEEA